MKVLKIAAIIFGSVIVVKIVRAAIANIFKIRMKSPLRMSERRENTLIRLLDNVAAYLIYFIALLMILSEFSIDVKALLAGAGVVGLAIGFGAQNLVKDVITGFFIIFEQQFAVGDFVRINNFEGTVEEIGLRTTKLKQWTGELHILPNSSITEVTNFSIHNSIAVVDVSIAYEEDIDRAQAIIEEVVREETPKYPEMVAEPEVLGIQAVAAAEIVIRVTAEVLPMTHFKVARELKKAIKIRLDEEGIELPYQKLISYHKTVSES
ncbi:MULTISPECIES: mechanosensitive ion channel family protein [Fictibacillus]|uniref:Mechanosensitive ion channel family protein n=1 Tax=Fictibacillus terranigra TaxID=3058424 RepID=A0ABT8E0J9_9BACL|nr:mechanosensitive ion channel family protein [Fictibacillus sp. CENA-BCM004]MDN4071436.1 mechanosensitive ion channel family protein [Fictibacillus sp. CENA-BCM004]